MKLVITAYILKIVFFYQPANRWKTTGFNRAGAGGINELLTLAPEKKDILFDLIDTYIRDVKTSLAYK